MNQDRFLTQFLFVWKNAWRMLWRDWRTGELNILALGLLIAVTSITAAGFFIDRVENGMKQQSAELIGADLVVSSSRNDLGSYAANAQKNGLITTTTIGFRSVIPGKTRPQLVEVKAVSKGYPLRGSLRISDTAFTSGELTRDIPDSGQVWVDAKLLQLLNINNGAVIQLGDKHFTVNKIIAYEPDRGGDLFSVAPRVLMNADDLPATHLIQQGALVSYRLLIKGSPDAIRSFHKYIKARLQPGQQVIDTEHGRPELQSALTNARRFLALAVIISVLLSGIAIATVANRFSRRHFETSAMLRCLGVKRKTIFQLFTLEILLLSLIISTAGVLLGYVTQLGIAQILNTLILAHLPAATLRPLLLAYASGIILLTGFALPPLLILKRVPLLRILRQDTAVKGNTNAFLYLSVLICIAVLLQWQLQEPRLVGMIMAGMFATLLVLSGSAYLLTHFLTRLRQRVGISWRFGLANIARHRRQSIIQIVAFGLGIMILLLFSIVRSDLLKDWQQSLPVDAPNYFIINVQSNQINNITHYFNQKKISPVKFYPMVRARLMAINHVKASADNYNNERAKHMITREFNLSWAAKPQSDNKIVAGKWWKADDFGKPLLSFEKKLADTLHIKIGDTLSFDINGVNTDFVVSNLRSVNWNTFKINFFTVIPPGVLEDSPASWVTSIYLNDQQKASLVPLVKRFSNVTVIDVDTIMTRLRSIMDRVILAVEFIFMFTLFAGLVVLYAIIQANQDERRFESAICRTLGASRSILLRGLITEFVTLGALSGLLAGLAANAIALLLATYAFDFEYHFDPSVVLMGFISGILIVGIAGVLGTYHVLTQPPLRTLRQAG